MFKQNAMNTSRRKNRLVSSSFSSVINVVGVAVVALLLFAHDDDNDNNAHRLFHRINARSSFRVANAFGYGVPSTVRSLTTSSSSSSRRRRAIKYNPHLPSSSSRCRSPNNNNNCVTFISGAKRRFLQQRHDGSLYSVNDEEVEEEAVDDDDDIEDTLYEDVNGVDDNNKEEEEEKDSPSTKDDDWEPNEETFQNLLQKMKDARREIENLDEEELVANLSAEEEDILKEDEVELEVEERARPHLWKEEDLEEIMAQAEQTNDDEDDDEFPFAPEDDVIYGGDNVTQFQESLVELNHTYQEYVSAAAETAELTRTNDTQLHRIESIDDEHVLWNVLDEDTRREILLLDEHVELDEHGEPDAVLLGKQRRQLIYDLDFNVTNLFLASFQVNPDAPVVLEHWMHQLRNWTRYEPVRERHFNFTWTDVDRADTDELDRYWRGAGHTQGAPQPNIKENPNVIEWDEGPLDFEEEYLLALESWMDEVYHEDDDVCLDDEDYMPADNPAAPENEPKPSPNSTDSTDDEIDPVLKDVAEFEEKYAHMTPEWREQYVRRTTFEVENKLNSEFCGHLVIACSPAEPDLVMAEKLTVRMAQEFGERVFVETRVVGHAKPEDHLYEIWLESWEVELLHSKRRAVFQRDWEGPREISDDYIDDMVTQIGFYISEDFKYSFIY